MSSFERKVAQPTLTHAPSTGAQQHQLTGPALGMRHGPAYEAGLSADA